MDVWMFVDRESELEDITGVKVETPEMIE